MRAIKIIPNTLLLPKKFGVLKFKITFLSLPWESTFGKYVSHGVYIRRLWRSFENFLKQQWLRFAPFMSVDVNKNQYVKLFFTKRLMTFLLPAHESPSGIIFEALRLSCSSVTNAFYFFFFF